MGDCLAGRDYRAISRWCTGIISNKQSNISYCGRVVMIEQHHIDIIAMPYVPGVTRGAIQHGGETNIANRILILRQQDIEAIFEPPLGFVVVEGAPFSHTMIRFMSMGVPTVIISEQHAELLKEGMEVMLNGATGQITTKISEDVESETGTLSVSRQPLTTTDGVPIHLRASVRNQEAAQRSRIEGAESIGLVRSEFLMPDDGSVPDSAFYTHAFGQICEAASPLPVTIRLLDVAADKIPAWMPALDSVGGALGLQGVRLYGIEPMKSVCQAQLSAINSLSDSYDIRVLIPYLVRHEELHYWVNFIRQQLSKPLPLGAMAETPASALDLANWFDLVDFVAVGCNDLMQCLFAADRDRAELRDYLDPYAPLLWRFMQQIATVAETQLDRIQLCGVLAQLPCVLPILLGLGYRAFSVEATLIPYLRQTITTTNVAEAQRLAQQICAASDSRQVLELLGLHDGSYQPFLVP
jgi:phosphoenolpyruvate-protein kinase (PTS system EI component)